MPISATSEQSLNKLKDWIEKYNKHYASHAIWSDNVENVLSSGKLMSAEHLLRVNNCASYEAGTYGDRHRTDISFLLEKMRLDPELKELGALFNESSKMKLMEAASLGFFTDEQDKLIFDDAAECQKVTLKDGKEYFIFTEGKSSYISIPNFEQRAMLGSAAIWFQDFLYKLEKRYPGFGRGQLQIAIELLTDTSIDKFLAKLWQLYCLLSEPEDHLKIAKKLNDIRHSCIAPSTLNHEIRGCHNAILWSYGDVVILKGNAKEYLSQINYAYDRSNYAKDAESLYRDFSNGKELFFLTPFENGGKFFSLDLKQEDVLIIGPQALLEKHAALQENIFFIEQMSTEELEFFAVPTRLRKTTATIANQEKDALDKVPTATVSSASFFSSTAITKDERHQTLKENTRGPSSSEEAINEKVKLRFP